MVSSEGFGARDVSSRLLNTSADYWCCKVMGIYKNFAILVVCLISSGCAVGVTHQYDVADTKFGLQTQSSISVAVHDQRPYVVNGTKTADFVGISRGGFGNPFDVTTASSVPLADDFATSIVSALKADGANVSMIKMRPQDSDIKVRSALLAAKTKRYVLLTLNEWKSDTYQNTALIYNILLRVFDSVGTLLTDERLQGRDDLGGDFLNPPGHSRKVVPIAFRRKLEILFKDSRVVQALR